MGHSIKSIYSLDMIFIFLYYFTSEIEQRFFYFDFLGDSDYLFAVLTTRCQCNYRHNMLYFDSDPIANLFWQKNVGKRKINHSE